MRPQLARGHASHARLRVVRTDAQRPPSRHGLRGAACCRACCRALLGRRTRGGRGGGGYLCIEVCSLSSQRTKNKPGHTERTSRDLRTGRQHTEWGSRSQGIGFLTPSNASAAWVMWVMWATERLCAPRGPRACPPGASARSRPYQSSCCGQALTCRSGSRGLKTRLLADPGTPGTLRV